MKGILRLDILYIGVIHILECLSYSANLSDLLLKRLPRPQDHNIFPIFPHLRPVKVSSLSHLRFFFLVTADWLTH